MHEAAFAGALDVVNFYIGRLTGDKNPKHSNGMTPLHLAADFGHLDIVKLITNTLFDKNPKSNQNITPLHFAAGQGHLDIVRFLIDHVENTDVRTKDGITPIGNPNKNVFSNHQVVLPSFFKILPSAFMAIWWHTCELPQQNGDETTRGRKKHLARFNKLTTPP